MIKVHIFGVYKEELRVSTSSNDVADEDDANEYCTLEGLTLKASTFRFVCKQNKINNDKELNFIMKNKTKKKNFTSFYTKMFYI